MERTTQLTVAIIGALALILALALLVNQATLVWANPGTLYVAPGGNCNGASPCYGSVQAAVDAAVSGDEIRVAAGTYTGVTSREGTMQVVHIDKTVTIRGGYTTNNWNASDPETNPTTLDAQQQGRVLFVTSDISPIIEGLHITGGDASDERGGGVYVRNATITLRGNTLFGNTAWWGGGVFIGYSDAILNGNTVISNTADYGGGLYLECTFALLDGDAIISNTAQYAGGGAYVIFSGYGGRSPIFSGVAIASNAANAGGGMLLGFTSPTLTNATITDNHANTTGGGLYINGASPRLLHVTIARNRGGDGSGVSVTDAEYFDPVYSTVALTNTILVSHTVGITVTDGNTATLEATLWGSGDWANGTDWSSTGTIISGTVNLWGSPAFVASDTGNYHVGPGSAAVDAGVDAGVSNDIDGHHRPYNSVPDLGADEIIAATMLSDAESTLIYTDTQGIPTVIQVPVGAVTEATDLIYTPIDTVAPPLGFAFANRAFDLDAYRDGLLLSGFTFGIPVTITLHYAETDVVGGDENTLVLEYWDDGGWVDAASTCTPTSIYDRHPDENWLAVPICHLSRFALFREEYTAYVYLPLVLRYQ